MNLSLKCLRCGDFTILYIYFTTWLFPSVYAFVIWEGKTDGFSSYVMFFTFLTFTEIIGYLEKKN